MGKRTIADRDKQATVWNFYKPRHTHAWNMLVLSWRQLDQLDDETALGFVTEYNWENFILRLWLYRTTTMTLTRLESVHDQAREAVKEFDSVFTNDKINHLKALRDMIVHFDDYAVGTGRGPAIRERDLDSWRKFTRERYERGSLSLELASSYSAAIDLRSRAKQVSGAFVDWLQRN